jgi:hypothetical protein
VQAIGALQKYDSAAHPALQGEAYALAGYAEIYLADLYCSGVPLSTLEFEGDYVYRAGATTQAIYQHAITLFDSAITLTADSVRLLNLARVGKGRALTDLGEYAAAATAIDSVPSDFRYQFSVLWSTLGGTNEPDTFLATLTTVSDREGINGLPYRSSGDPRTQTVSAGTNRFSVPLYFPAKYGAPGATTDLVVASGIEARLIAAEAALNTGDVSTWLTTLNALRTDGTFTTTPSSDPDSVGVIDTTWNAGIGGVAGLKPISDPGTTQTRVDTMFAERAAWLFVTGERQGDLRRLIRQYGRNPESVYPTGSYVSPATGTPYGTDVNMPVPNTEQANPLFTGCFNRGA